MRISSGSYKGKSLQVPKHGVTPTSEMLRQSVMSIIRPFVREARVMDICAGTGAVGIEALSNGAAYCLFVEHNPKVYTYLHKNLESIVPEKSSWHCFQHNAGELSPELMDESPESYDIIFADPFYDDAEELFPRIHDFAMKMLKPGGTFIFEHGQEMDMEKYADFSRTKKYGDSHLSQFSRIQS